MSALTINLRETSPAEIFGLQEIAVQRLLPGIQEALDGWAEARCTPGEAVAKAVAACLSHNEEAFCLVLLSTTMARHAVIEEVHNLEEERSAAWLKQLEEDEQETSGRTKSGIIIDLSKA